MSRSLLEMQETCILSGRMSDNGIQRGQGMLWKWMDGRIVKDDPMGCETYSITLGTTETPDEGHNTIALCRGGESSRGSHVVDFEGRRSQGAREREREEADSLGLDRARTGGLTVSGPTSSLITW